MSLPLLVPCVHNPESLNPKFSPSYRHFDPPRKPGAARPLLWVLEGTGAFAAEGFEPDIHLLHVYGRLVQMFSF